MTFWHNQKAKLLAELEGLIEGEERDLTKYNKNISRNIKPKDFISEQSDEVKHEKDFEENCIVLSEYTNKSVREMSVKEYFTLLSHHNEKIRKHGRQSNTTRRHNTTR